jgi:PAS domain S-box-containing protein
MIAEPIGHASVGAPIVGGRWFFRLILFLAIMTVTFAPLALIFPGRDPIGRFLQTLVTGLGFLAAAGFAWRGRGGSAVVTAAGTLLGGSIVSAYAAPPYAAESLGVAVIAAVLVLPGTARRAIWPTMVAIGLAGVTAIAISDARDGITILNPGGTVVSATAVLAVALALVGWTHVRLADALERARRARTELDASEQRFRTLIETAPDGIMVLDAATLRAVSANQRALEMFRYPTVAELAAADLDDFYPERQPDGQPSLDARRAAIEATLAGERVMTEVVYRRSDGSVFTAEARSSLAVIAGRIEIRLSLTDISDRVAAMRERDLSEARFRSLFASSPNAILVANHAGQIVDASDRAAEVFGCSTDVLRTMNVDQFVPSAQRAAHADQRAGFNAAPKERAIGDHGELSALRADGTPFPAEIGLSWFDSDEGRFATIVVVDVTARREAERAARDATETIRGVFDASPAGIAVTGLDGTVRLWNRAMVELTGIPVDEAIGQPDPSVPDDELADRAAIRCAVGRGETRTGSDIVLTRGSGTFSALGSFGPLHDASGTVTGVVSVIEDVTAMRTLEAQVNRKARLESVGQLAGGIAHDINNVLTAIGGFASLSLDDLDAGLPVDREAIATIAEGAARTSALTRQLLAFARRDVRPAETIALGESVRAVEPMLRGLIGEHIALKIRTTDRGHVRIAGSQVEQLVINLVVNARDALPNGGTIQVEVANITIPDARIRHLGIADGPYIGLTVSDNGTGMSPEVAERVFDPFFTTKGPDEGTGLGLATVHGIVTEAGGHVSVETAPDAGATFRILLPLMDHVAVEPHVPAVAGHGNETILLVEDEELVRALASRVLERAGFTVLVAASAAEALALSAEHIGRIDLLVTDVIMPRVLGPELALLLNRERPGLGVLFTSGYTAGGSGVTAAIPPDARFLDKPFSPSDLVAAVRAAIDEDSVSLPG